MTLTPQAPSSAPVQFGKYLLDGELAQGGMARVFQARLRGPGGFEKKLVVKQILPKLASDPSFIELFVREANTVVQLSHPQIVPVYELGVVDGVYYLSMERVEGATIAEMLRQGPLPEALVAHVGVQACEALQYAHERFGVIHRDVTPRNIIVDSTGNVRLLDFGIATPMEGTGDGRLFGSPGYLSPEQFRGEALSPRSDLFSLGAVLYEALTGERAFPRAADGDKDATLDPTVPLTAMDGLSADVVETLNVMLAQEPTTRPSSAAEVGSKLRHWLSRTHPQGVLRELSHRAQEAAEQVARRRHTAQPLTPSQPRTEPREARSIATRAELSGLFEQGTEPLAGRTGNRRPLSQSESDDALAAAERPAGASAGAATAEAAQAPQPSVAGAVPPGRSTRATALLWLVGAALAGAAGAAALLRPEPDAAIERPRDDQAPSPTTTPGPAEQSASAAGTSGLAPLAGKPAQPTSPPNTSPPASQPKDNPVGLQGAARLERTSEARQAPSDQPDREASLTVNAIPWARVSLNGKELGNTPLRRLGVRAGKHTLQLECPPLGRSESLRLNLDAGELRKIVVDLTVDPAKITRD